MIKIIIGIIFFAIAQNSLAQSYLEFVENKGQWADNIAYKGQLHTGAIALKPDGGYRMLQHNTADLQAIHNYFHPDGNGNTTAKIKDSKSPGLHSHVYEVSFLGGNKNPEAIAEKPQDTYNNYYIDNDKKHWASGCKIFQAITYKNIYPNIDVHYYTDNGKLKYDFIVRPGGNPSSIALMFDGVDELKIKKQNLIITTSVTEEKELAPYTFQPSTQGKKIVDCSYKLVGNVVRFTIDDYNKTLPLIIDPTKVFSTFTGSTADNWGFTATYDGAGNFYAGGIVFSSGFPVTNGSTYQGGVDSDDGNKYDIGIMKFNALGTQRIYATYIGGSNGNDQPHSLIVDGNGDLILSGRTNSDNYPTTLPNLGPCGLKDIILTKLNSAGNISASIKIGGTKDDGMNIKSKYSNSPTGTLSLNRNYGDDARSEVIVDDANDILLVSCTQSTDFYTTATAFQASNGGVGSAIARKQDAVFIKASNDLSDVKVSSYLGGNNDDAAFVIAISPITKNIYLAGGTASTNFPGDKTGVYQSTFQGDDCDGFIAELNAAGTQLIRSSYFGTNGAENVYGIQVDKYGFIYIMGTGNGQWPVFNAPYSNAFAKQFIAKVRPNLSSLVYSTTFGTNAAHPNISPTAFLVDRCENVYVSGWGGSINTGQGYNTSGTSGLPLKNALQTTTDGNDFYFFVLERGANSQLYGDFFGQTGGSAGEHVDGGTSRFDKDGIIYQSLCANCAGGAVFPTTPGAYSTANGSTNCNLAAVKIAFNLSGVGAGVRSSIRGVQGDTSGCVPLAIKFIDTLGQGISYTWNFGDGSPIVTTKKPDTMHVYNNIGYYKVCVVSIDSSTCNIVDTSCRTMRIRSDSAKLKLTWRKVGDCISNTYEFDNRASIYPPLKPFKSNSFKINFGDGVIQNMGYTKVTHPYPSAGVYNGWMVLVDTNYCNTPDTLFFTLNIIPNIKAKFTPPATGCLSSDIQFTNNSNGGEEVLWSFGDGTTSSINNPKHLYTATGTYTIKLLIIDTNSCNKRDSISFPMKISKSPVAAFIFTPNPTRVNSPVTFINQSTDATSYLWVLGEGDTVRTTDKNKFIQHLYKRTFGFNVCLTVFNQFGCVDSVCKIVNARVNQLFDVPSALAPEGTNKKIYVKGFGIQKISWNIYNRWGILMFSTEDVKEGWDGRYKGEIQPQDVYHYTLIVEFFDGKKQTKTGDITLLR